MHVSVNIKIRGAIDRYSIISIVVLIVGLVFLITFWQGIWRRYEVRRNTRNAEKQCLDRQPEHITLTPLTIDSPLDMTVFDLAIEPSTILEASFSSDPELISKGKIHNWNSLFTIKQSNYIINLMYLNTYTPEEFNDKYAEVIDYLSVKSKTLAELNKMTNEDYLKYRDRIAKKAGLQPNGIFYLLDQPKLKAYFVDYPDSKRGRGNVYILDQDNTYEFLFYLNDMKDSSKNAKDFLARIHPKQSSKIINSEIDWNVSIDQAMDNGDYSFYKDPCDTVPKKAKRFGPGMPGMPYPSSRRP